VEAVARVSCFSQKQVARGAEFAGVK